LKVQPLFREEPPSKKRTVVKEPSEWKKRKQLGPTNQSETAVEFAVGILDPRKVSTIQRWPSKNREASNKKTGIRADSGGGCTQRAQSSLLAQIKEWKNRPCQFEKWVQEGEKKLMNQTRRKMAPQKKSAQVLQEDQRTTKRTLTTWGVETEPRKTV